MPARPLWVTLLCVVASLLVATTLATTANADVVRGQSLYTAFCRSCHSPQGEGGDAIRAGAANPAAIRGALQNVAAMRLLASFLDASEIEDIAEYLGVLYGVTPPPPPPAAEVTVVEFYNVGLDHYFMTAIPDEVAALDAGTQVRGWTRTGLSFIAYATLVGAPAGASPVCRFYLPPPSGDSHFYSASPVECEEGRVKFPQFVYESPEVMVSVLPDLVSGLCPEGLLQVYRLWNQRADNNHRFTASRDVRALMIGRGSLPEGYGPEGVAFCTPAAT